MNKVIIFLLGIFLSSTGLFFIILYLNLLTMGYDFFDYFRFIFTRYECYLLIVGILLILFCYKDRITSYIRSKYKS